MPPLILVVLVIFIVALFSVQNALPVAISFLAWRFDASLAIIALLFFLAGMITVGALSWIQIKRRARKKPSRQALISAGCKSHKHWPQAGSGFAGTHR